MPVHDEADADYVKKSDGMRVRSDVTGRGRAANHDSLQGPIGST